MRSQDIRERFLDFFTNRGHERLPSSSLIPLDDPSLLFTSAGMVPLKPYILGARSLPGNRATSCQKCFRADDVEEVGDDVHHTFFEMLGNWSFGDYFKGEAIELAWELLTRDLGLDARRLVPSVYPDDSEAEDVWVHRIGIPRSRVSRVMDNWWQAGPTGPCGYDSEIYWDRGSPCSCGRDDCLPQDECGGGRWSEIWNLVFMEFDQDGSGGRTPLPRPCVDTGMGLERMAAVLQEVGGNYDTDLLRPLVDGFERRSSADRERPGDVVALRVLADHLRAGAFLIGDGVIPDNEGRGYVLRRVVRRASLFGRRIALAEGLAGGVADLGAVMGIAYPEIAEHRALIEDTLRREEAAFERTLGAGLERLERLLGAGGSRLSGEDAFRLHDTHGFPADLTVELARERGVEVDMDGFRAAMEEQRRKSQGAATAVPGWSAVAPDHPTAFVGYDSLEAESVAVHVRGPAGTAEIAAGERGEVVLDPTPFYAEGGGQVGDHGVVRWAGGCGDVVDTQAAGAAARATRVSTVEVREGVLRAGERVHATVDA
ncbi:MAG TPA: alanine--tRNA ligase, partial [Candidatus Dormibacteraeota bacterium]|nr:alanine--tRNA ligase [Candidatus Dormibacteraeota bacterium]